MFLAKRKAAIEMLSLVIGEVMDSVLVWGRTSMKRCQPGLFVDLEGIWWVGEKQLKVANIAAVKE